MIIPLIVCGKNYYRRYIGRKFDFAVTSGAPLTADVVETLRINPSVLEIITDDDDEGQPA